MENIEQKINKICQKLKKEYKAEIVRGQIVEGDQISTIQISVKKSGGDKETSYNQPLGLIEIKKDQAIFKPIEDNQSNLSKAFKIMIFALGFFGLRKIFKTKKKWDAD